MKKFKNLISVLLLLAIMLGCMPISAIATETEQLSEQIIEQEFILAPEDTKVTEVVSARDESVKHFKLPDGTYEAVSYGHAVHRKDANGVWKDINNDLTLKTVGTKQLYTTADARVSFEKDANALTISENGYNIYMSLLTPSNQSGNMTATTEPMAVSVTNSSVQRAEYYDTIDEAIEINNRSSIVYSNVLANTDVEYVLSGNDVKENIIVKTKQNTYEYGFMLALSGLIPVLENNVILLKDEITDEEKYIIPAPYMYDANGEYSYDVEYDLIHAGGEKYLLTVTADAEWINAEERAWPVTVDPSVQSSSGIDTYISSANPTTKYGTAQTALLNTGAIKNTPLIRVTLPQIPIGTSGATVNYANFYVYYYSTKTSGTVSIGAFEIKGSWYETSVTHNTAPSISKTAAATTSFMITSSNNSSNPALGIFQITNAVRDSYDRNAPFYGIALEHTMGSTDIIIKTRESGTTYAPYLRLNYSYTGIESGIYLMKNAGLSTWMQIDDDDGGQNYSTTGKDIEAHSFNANGCQLWHFEFLSTGYYKITSAPSGKVLSINPSYKNSSTVALRQEVYSSETTQHWKITKSSAGNYVFRAVSSFAYTIDWCMFSGDTTLAAEKVRQKQYTSDSDYRDEWSVTKINGTTTIEVEDQEEDNWCWAATAKMFAKHYYPTVSRTQSQAVNHVLGSVIDEGANIYKFQEAVNYYIAGVTQTPPDTVVMEGYIYTEDTFAQLINNGHVVAMLRLIDNSYGHYYLICGYVQINSTYWFLIKDPNYTSTGVYLMSYQRLVHGNNAQVGEVADNSLFVTGLSPVIN